MKILIQRKIHAADNAYAKVRSLNAEDERVSDRAKLQLTNYASSLEGIGSFFLLGVIKSLLSGKQMDTSDAAVLVGKKFLSGWLSSATSLTTGAGENENKENSI